MMYVKKDPVDPQRLFQLRAAAGDCPVLILTHDNPDPDALVSGKVLATLLRSAWNIPSRLVYSGLILRTENRALLNLLTPEWEHSDTITGLDQYSAIALVDTQPGAGNNRLPVGCHPEIVFDHHQPLRDLLGMVTFVDVRPEIGATVTMLDQYMEAAEIVPDSQLATAMFYAVKTDTRGLSRGASASDKRTYIKLLTQIDHQILTRVEHTGLPQAYFRDFSEGLHAARVYDHSVVADLGEMHRPDLASEIADLFIRLDQARAVLCLGWHGETLHLSIRTEPMSQNAGDLIQNVVVESGKAGGHGTMAGGQVPLAGQSPGKLVDEIVRRFLDVMGETGESQPLC